MKRGIAACAVVLAGVCILLFMTSPRSSPLISIRFVGFTNSQAAGKAALFELKNLDEKAIQRGRFCTIYGSTASGVSSNVSVALSTNEVLLNAHESETLTLITPEWTSEWQPGFSFTFPLATMRKLQRWVPWRLPMDDRAFVQWGPKITNALYGFSKSDSSNAANSNELRP